MRRGPGTSLLLYVAFAVAIAVGCGWGLPGSDSWAADSISPRSCGLFAIAETYWPGHFHTYPPLHMAILTLLSLPWMALAASRVGTSTAALGAELVKPLYMTGIEILARVLAASMALGIVHNTVRLWTRLAGRRAGLVAGAVVATNAVLVYYAHTGNLEVPYLFWTTWALVEIDRVAAGEPREKQALLLATLAALTKDQAAAALLVPLVVYVAVVPRASRGTPVLRGSLVKAVLLAALVYGIGSGALVNPVGFGRRVAFLLGPASQTWAEYPRSWRGLLALATDTVRDVPRFTSWPIAALAAVGLALVLARARGGTRARALLPFVAATSFVLLFNVAARRTEERFLLPASLLFLPYASVAFDEAWTRLGASRPGRSALLLAGLVALVPALVGVASVDATLVADSRYAAGQFLSALRPGTRVEVYGGPIFLPRIPPALGATRPGKDPIAERQEIPGVADLVDPAMDPRPRAPDVLVLETQLSSVEATRMTGPHPYGVMQYRDAQSSAFLGELLDGSLGYRSVLRATCEVPWPLTCRRIHGSTGGEVWIYALAGR
jgi:hypothetical protein